jgi:hypothetical protein
VNASEDVQTSLGEHQGQHGGIHVKFIKNRSEAMTNPAAEKNAIEIVDAFMDQEFEDQANAAAWLVKRIAAALEQAERKGKEAITETGDFRSGGP